MIRDIHKVVNDEINSLSTPFQQTLHGRQSISHSPTSLNNETVPNTVEARFFPNTSPSHWEVKTLHQLPSDTRQKEHYFDLYQPWASILYKSFLSITLPAIRIRNPTQNPKIRIAWCRKPLFALISSIYTIIDKKQYQPMNRYTLDNHFEYFLTSSQKEDMRYIIGDTPEMTSWDTEKPAFDGKLYPPWFYASSMTKGFPINRFGPGRCYHVVSFHNVKEIIRLGQVQEDGSIVPIRFDPNLVTIGSFEPANMYVVYSTINEGDLMAYNAVNFSIIYDDIIILNEGITNKDNITSGGIIRTQINVNEPCNAIHWVVEDVQDVDCHNYFHYPQCLMKQVYLRYGFDVKYVFTPEMMVPSASWGAYPSLPRERGYNGYSVAFDNGEVFLTKNGINYGELKATLEFNLLPNNKTYNVYVLLYVTKSIDIGKV